MWLPLTTAKSYENDNGENSNTPQYEIQTNHIGKSPLVIHELSSTINREEYFESNEQSYFFKVPTIYAPC